jgi:hypothetical protein
MTGCLSNCSNNGVCGLNSANKFYCNCNSFFTGDSCQTDTRACSSSPCKNGANCSEIIIPNQPNSYNCSCSSSLFYGTNCEFKIDVCKGYDCSSHGTCYDNFSSPACNCFENYFGDICQNKTEALVAIQKTIEFTSYLAIGILSGFFVAILIMDYFSFVHAIVVQFFKK